MKWSELRRVLGGKLEAQKKPGSKHDMWLVSSNGIPIGIVLDSHGNGELKSREIGNIARSMHINEYTLKELVRCNISREAYCAKVG